MRREVSTEDLQRRYASSDMAKIGCNGCAGCWSCCEGMGDSVVLDPLDVHRLSAGLSMDFGALAQRYLELGVVDGIILPHLRMTGARERCGFLDPQGRCSIHAFRPGVCRLFPLGRLYEDGGFCYFLQHEECRARVKTKVKISKWLDTPELARYEKFVLDWHSLTEEIRGRLEAETGRDGNAEDRAGASENGRADAAPDGQLARDMNVYLLETFYGKPYVEPAGFYDQFEERRIQMRKLLKVL